MRPFFKRKNALESWDRELSNAFFRLKNDLLEQKLWTVLVNMFFGVSILLPNSSKSGSSKIRLPYYFYVLLSDTNAKWVERTVRFVPEGDFSKEEGVGKLISRAVQRFSPIEKWFHGAKVVPLTTFWFLWSLITWQQWSIILCPAWARCFGRRRWIRLVESFQNTSGMS